MKDISVDKDYLEILAKELLSKLIQANLINSGISRKEFGRALNIVNSFLIEKSDHSDISKKETTPLSENLFSV